VEAEIKLMPRSPAPLLPMTLGNMRTNGVRSLAVSCWLCHHDAVLASTPGPMTCSCPSSARSVVCTGCGIVGADARPYWKERRLRGRVTGAQWKA
jgi:hypothetical protein